MLEKITTYVEAHPVPSMLALGVIALITLKLKSDDLAMLLIFGLTLWCCGA